jgi:DNA polymerase-3 subunit alpha
MKENFIHLNVKTIYSILNSTIKIDSLIKQAKALEYDTIAVTDHNNLYGSYVFVQKCKENNIKPIVGLEAVLTNLDANEKNPEEKRFNITLLAQNNDGLHDLMKISSFAHHNQYYEPRIDYKNLKELNTHDKIIALSGNEMGEIPFMIINMATEQEIIKKIKFYNELFNNKFYLEIIDNDHYKQIAINEKLLYIAEKYNFKYVVTNDSRYLFQNEKESHDCLVAIKYKTNITDTNVPRLDSSSNWLKAKHEICIGTDKYNNGILETKNIADMIVDDYFNDKKIHIPTIDSEVKQFNRLQDICRKNLTILTSKMTPEKRQVYQERAYLELGLIRKYGIASYFMILADIMEFCRQKNIYTGAGRGSAAGSLIAFLSKITKVNPIKYKLLFERFINDGRLKNGTLPDIDIDIQDSRRSEVIEYIQTKYGEKNTSHIITFNILKDKSAIKGAARACGLNFETANEITKNLPNDFSFDSKEQTQDIQNFIAKYPKIFTLAKSIRGAIQHAGMHAAGIIISDEDLTNIIPTTIVEEKNGEYKEASQFDMKSAESLGLIKIDVLGLTTQNLLFETVQAIKKYQKKDVDINSITLNDVNVFNNIFTTKMTTGVFQFGSKVMKNAIHNIKPSSIEELTVVTSIARPGSKDFIDIYAANKQNPSQIQYIDNSLKNILEETKGIIIYQEQVMEICKQYAGFSLEESDNIRRAIGKKIHHVIQNYQDIFVNGAIKMGHDEKKAKEIYSLFISFADYAFNKSHALSYSIISYQTAYLKNYYTLEFMMSFLNNELIRANNSPERTQEVCFEIERECKFFNIKILPPDINKSEELFIIENGAIRYGLAAIKDIGISVAQTIKNNRKNEPYIDFVDFLYKNNKSTVSKRGVISLILSNCFSEIINNRYSLMQNMEKIRRALEKEQKNKQKGQSSFDFLNKYTDQDFNLNTEECLFTKIELLNKEKELLGLYVSGHPFDDYVDKFQKAKNTIDETFFMEKGKDVHICCMVKNIKYVQTKDKKDMCFLDVEDFTGRGSITIFPLLFVDIEDLLEINSIYYIRGKINVYNDRKSILADRVNKVSIKKKIV